MNRILNRLITSLTLFIILFLGLITLLPSSGLAIASPKAGTACSQPGVGNGSLTCGSCKSDGTGCVWEATGDKDTVCKNTSNTDGTVNQSQVQTCLAKSPVIVRLQEIVDFLSAGVGVIVVGVILVGGIQYILAGDNPQRLTSARQRIINGLIALFAFLFIFAFLQWLIPGGVF